ncbi:unnamed protein product [Rotaria sordida]|uniref:Adrenodoxin reductase n=1 Tax=Rotaria sordida TaxID=392033 RepID=A0A814S6U3_9BILA|nr:unnamed protein product [Rotaria sordida]
MFTHVIRHCFISCLIRRSLSIVPNNSTVPSSSIRICCIVGSGPAAEHERVRFIRNIHVGKTIGLKELQEFYHIIVLAYGSSVEHNLHISGVPENAQLRPQLDHTDRAIIIGIGNVALDCARMLLTSIDDLAKTDITDIALDTLRQSRIRHVILVGRREPMQVLFTIKEFRELTKLNGVQSMLNKDFN